jgi:multidrug resistance efflux pump
MSSRAEARSQPSLPCTPKPWPSGSKADARRTNTTQPQLLHDRRPVSGIVGKKTVEAGANVSPGQQLMSVVPLDDIWITADFKETQPRLMKPRDRVLFSVDAYGREYRGKAAASAAT